ncbi:MAG: DUF1206 domain-containing protein [Dermatophilaceae bacterium]
MSEHVNELAGQAQGIARDAKDHPALHAAVRVGYAGSGVIHLLIAWAALGIAWAPSGGGTADQSGALAQVAAQPWGRPLLWVTVVGFAGLGLWQLTEAIGGWHPHGRDGLAARSKALGKMVAYLALGWTAATFARGGSSDSSTQTTDATRTLMSGAGGQFLVALLGVAVISIGAYHVFKGWTKKFLEDLVTDPGEVAEQAGRYGYMAKGVALAIVGGLFIVAAWHARANEARGLDGALRTLAETPHGTVLLTVVAVGIAAYGLYSFFRARYTKL